MACMRSLAHFLMTKYHNRNHWTIQSNPTQFHPSKNKEPRRVSQFIQWNTVATTAIHDHHQHYRCGNNSNANSSFTTENTCRYFTDNSSLYKFICGSEFWWKWFKKRNKLIKTLEYLTKSWSNIWPLTSAGDGQALHHFVLCKRIFRFYFATGRQQTILWISV